ncbi:uncharacterized protein LOC121369963 [Gigantopelta aegis]|uniref:uncharacterized protein LOC121369963 n=1 Tax=Gigantopelta aegis TaxID=1735272 RepID=UPI001B88E0E7|nr:uncharacterized protein LOC121369963 [Gigantopelta aegis]
MDFTKFLACTLMFLCLEVLITTSGSATPSRYESDESNSARISSEHRLHLRIQRGLISRLKNKLGHRKRHGLPHHPRNPQSGGSGVTKITIQKPSNIDRGLQAIQTGADIFGHGVQLKHILQQKQQQQQQQPSYVDVGAKHEVVKVPTFYVAPKPNVPHKKNSASGIAVSLKVIVAVFIYKNILTDYLA